MRHLLAHARPHLNLRGRKSRRTPSSGPFASPNTATPIKVHRDQHPGFAIDYTYPPPSILAGISQSNTLDKVLIHLRPVVPKFKERVLGQGGSISVKLGEKESIPIFARLLAKIAHSFSAAERGVDGFRAFLPSVILGKEETYTLSDLVGSSITDEPRGNETHEIDFCPELGVGGQFIVVRVRLFANMENPPRAHYVVAGTPL